MGEEMKLFALLAVAAVQARQVNTFAEVELNGACVEGDTCTTENAECLAPPPPPSARADEKKCLCKPGFKEDTSACVADPPALGGACDNEKEEVKCTGDNQVCGAESAVCECDTGFKPNATNDACEADAAPKPPALGEPCDDKNVCSLENAECGAESKTCDCKADFVAKDGACVKLTPIGETCDGNNSSCTGEGQVCTDGTCSCDTGFKEEAGACSKSSAMTYGLGAACLALILA